MRISLLRYRLSHIVPALIINLIGIICISPKAAIAQVPYLSASDPLMVDLNTQRTQAELDNQLPSLALPEFVLEGTLDFGEYEDYARLPTTGQHYYQAGEFQIAAQYWQTAQEFYQNLQTLGEDRIFEVLSVEDYLRGTQQGLFDSPEGVIPYAAAQEERLLDVLGITAFQLGLLDAAKTNFEQALAKAESLQNDKAIAAALNNLGVVHQQQGDYDRAMDHYEKALAIAEGLCCENVPAFVRSNRFRDFTFYADHLSVDILINIGHLYQELGQHQTALNVLELAFSHVNQSVISSFSVPVQPSSYEGVWANNIFNSAIRVFAGSSLAHMGQTDQGIQLMNEGLAIARNHQDQTRQFLALTHLNPVLINLESGKFSPQIGSWC